MLGAIVRGEQKTWFFKLVAPVDRAAAVAEEVDELIASITFNEGEAAPSWQTPDGWEDKGRSGMRFTTLVAPGDGDPLELSVTDLAASGEFASELLSNVNRWRGQMKLPPVTAADLAESVTPIASAPEGSVKIDLAGWFDGGSMRPPMMGGGGPRAGGRPPAFSAPPTAGAPPAGGGPAKPIAYDKPDKWVELPPRSMRVVSFRTSDADDAAELRVSRWPAAGMMGDVLMNVNRWRGQVGLAPTDAATLEQESTPLDFGGIEGRLVEQAGAERSILVGMATRGGQVWFFLLDGTPDVVSAERETFIEWLSSVRFEAPEGN